MALTKDIVTVHGISVNSAYLRIESVYLSSKTEMQYAIYAYTDSSHVHSFWFQQITFEYNLLGENPFKQAYLHAKTLSEFLGATDC